HSNKKPNVIVSSVAHVIIKPSIVQYHRENETICITSTLIIFRKRKHILKNCHKLHEIPFTCMF
ncbi:hypothetical protein BCR42DRAFT_429215, partial [Absidia repens]